MKIILSLILLFGSVCFADGSENRCKISTAIKFGASSVLSPGSSLAILENTLRKCLIVQNNGQSPLVTYMAFSSGGASLAITSGTIFNPPTVPTGPIYLWSNLGGSSNGASTTIIEGN